MRKSDWLPTGVVRAIVDAAVLMGLDIGRVGYLTRRDVPSGNTSLVGVGPWWVAWPSGGAWRGRAARSLPSSLAVGGTGWRRIPILVVAVAAAALLVQAP